VEFSDLQIIAREEIVAEDYAFAEMTFTAKARPRGVAMEPMLMHGRATEVMHRSSDGGWRYHIDHASMLQPPMP
jgi:ketosteroid isomerase-like protein